MIQAMGIHFSPTMDQLRKGSQTIISRQVAMRQSFYERNDVPIYSGYAKFIDEHTIEVDGQRFTSSHFVLAPGTRPFRPAGVDFNTREYSIAIRFLISRTSRHRSRFMERA